MYVTMMMTDQIPLELPPLLNGEVAMMPHLVNGDAAQQVILVQVNPGETFTIRAEDGTLQCIQVWFGKKSLHMKSRKHNEAFWLMNLVSFKFSSHGESWKITSKKSAVAHL
ncbi:PREDICTED: fibronectin type III domain-containing protein 3B-like [Rhinopithecus bieti]|uniref:fibronectin type III domain-containing protein 3B-like n=1 Tax=Rhinopithecus bieti TaxID=61621 RepID=UPI00083C84FD|nr:PREDICTED: fibronectin type III domain-containing protein 3B-like [Rhinopithecus bieti]XP_017744969.1 PREDICTED: fibronectin type III domain-containing protein 3B-like [Rhinopithecus bieti]